MFFNRNDGPGGGQDKRVLPLLPLRDIIVFPHMVVPLFVGREKSINALEEAMSGDKEILLAAQRKAKTNEPAPQDIFERVCFVDDLPTDVRKRLGFKDIDRQQRIGQYLRKRIDAYHAPDER